MGILSVYYVEVWVFLFDYENAIRPDLLQTRGCYFTRQRISYRINAIVTVCPYTQFPDTGTVWVDYILQHKMIKLKFPKYCFISFHNVGIYQKDVTSQILNNSNPMMVSEEFLIKTCYNIGGEINTTCTINSNEQKY